jgi:hypothetical protein
MKTSYYQNKALDASKHLIVQTSNGHPQWGIQPEIALHSLKPPLALMGADIPVDVFAERYRIHLDTVGVEQIREELKQLNEAAAKTDREAILCCFESLKKEDQHCHRRMFADWWFEKTGETLAEFKTEPTQIQTEFLI